MSQNGQTHLKNIAAFADHFVSNHFVVLSIKGLKYLQDIKRILCCEEINFTSHSVVHYRYMAVLYVFI